MNLNNDRRRLGEAIRVADRRWTVELKTYPDVSSTFLAQIGHGTPTPDTYRSKRTELPVLLWANEGNVATAQDTLYGALSWGPDSLVSKLAALDWVRGVEVHAVGAREDGPTGFLFAEIRVTVQLED